MKKICFRLISLTLISFFALISVGEAKRTPSTRLAYTAKHNARITRHKAALQPKRRVTLINQSRRPPVVMKKAHQRPQVTLRRQVTPKITQRQRPTPTVKRSQQRQTKIIRPYQKTVIQRIQQPQAFPTITNQCYQASVTKPISTPSVKHQHRQLLVARNNRSRSLPLLLRRVQSKSPAQQKLDYFALLNSHTQQNARISGLDHLFAKNFLGQGQTIALIEISGSWDVMRKAINHKGGGFINGYVQENYRRNFLSPIGGPGVDPNGKIDLGHFNASKNDTHGSEVSSCLMDLAPQAKVLPVSTYQTLSGQSYDIADALLDLAKRPDVRVINISGGRYSCNAKIDFDENYKMTTTYTFPPKHLEAFKAIARTGKVIVFAAGNKGIRLDTTNDSHPGNLAFEKYALHLLENLDPETRQSVIFAGNLDPDTCAIRQASNRPGKLQQAQETFLCSPGTVKLSYGYDSEYLTGTSYSAPYICAALANLLSRSNNITPRQAVKALLETAEQRPERHIYGRGIIRADRALEALERDLARR